MNIKRITVIHVLITLVLSIIFIFLFDYKVILGIILGSGVGYLNFYLLNKKINSLTDEEIPNMAKILKSNRNFRYLVLILLLVLAGFIPQLFNIIAVCLSVLINKISFYIDMLISK